MHLLVYPPLDGSLEIVKAPLEKLVGNRQGVLQCRQNEQHMFRISHAQSKIILSAPYLSVVSNRYAIPPEHGKRLERLATGKIIIYILFVFSI